MKNTVQENSKIIIRFTYNYMYIVYALTIIMTGRICGGKLPFWLL